MARRLGVHNIRRFDEDGIRRIQRNEYQSKEGIIRSGTKPDDFYLDRAEKLYAEYGVDRIFLLSPMKYRKHLEELADNILEKCRNEWERSPDDWLFKEDVHIFTDRIEVIDSEKRGESEKVKIIQIDLVSNIYSTAEYYLSRINKNPRELSKNLVRILAGLYPKEWKDNLPQDIPKYDPKDVLQLLILMTSEIPLKKYFEFFHGFFTGESWNIGRILHELETLSEIPTSYNEGLEDLHFVLRIIHKSLSITSFSEIAELKSEIDNYFIAIPHPENYTDMLYRKIHELCDLMKKFQEETHFQDKLYFLDQSRNIIRESEVLVKSKFVEPFGIFYLDILNNWMNIADKEGDLLLSKASIEARLQTKRAIWKKKLLVSLNIKNIGTSSAENIEVFLQNSDEYEILGQNTHHIGILHRNRDEDIDFYINPSKKDSVNLAFSIFYGENNRSNVSDVLVFVQKGGFREISNPYYFTRPAEDEMFFNREDLFRWIEENMKKSTVYQNVILEGQRRTGKTSFLKELQKIIKKEHYCIFVDLEFYQDIEEVIFLREVCQEIKRTISYDISVPSLKEFVNRRHLAFKDYIENISSNNPKRIILIFDEFDKIASNIKKGLFKPGLLLFLRGFFQHNSHVNAIISGNFDFGKLNSTEWKEFFTIFNLKRIGILDEDSARDLVVQPVRDYLQFDQYAIKKILDFSGRNPFYIQLLCHALVNYINEKKKQNFVEAEDVSTVVLEEAKESVEPILKLTWNDFSPIEKNTLFALSQLRNQYRRFVNLEEIRYYLRQQGMKVGKWKVLEILDVLIEKDIVIKSGEDPPFYDFNIVFLRDWIEEHGRFYG
jgi:hypothetical protein